MPYFIESENPDCGSGQWATVKEDGEVMGCHTTKQAAIDQALAIALAEDSTFEGERRNDSGPPALISDIDRTLFVASGVNDELLDYFATFENTFLFIVTGRLETQREITEVALSDAGVIYEQLFMRPNDDITSEDFKGETASDLLEVYNVMIAVDDDSSARSRYRALGITALDVDEIPAVVLEERQVDLTPPAYMRASARRGLEWHREGLSGDGIVDRTIREATAMSQGNVSADKWVRIRAWIARHLVDMDAPQNTPGDDNYPGPGAVAMALWGGGGSKRSAERALEYADGVVGRIEAENDERSTVTGEAKSKLETRIVEVEAFDVREEADGMHLEGYAALFNSRSENLGGFTETIKPGAFRASLKSRNDVKLLWNHDSGAVLGSTRAGTLTLTEDERGLRVSATLPNTSYGRDAKELISRGDVSAFSFGFSMPARGGDEWNADGTERVLKSVRLHEVSLVAFPAYPETSGTATVRGLDKIAKRADVDADALADALLKIENGEDITQDDRQLLNTVLDALSPEPETEEPTSDLGMLALKKKKLELLMKGI
jgi:HK97 family phage prohead protease